MHESAYEGLDDLQALEENAQIYNQHLVHKFLQIANSTNVRINSVLDFGAGIGSLALEWKKQTQIPVDCFEIDKQQANFIRNREMNCFDSLEQVQQRYEFIYMSNVLEHIEDDVAVLKEIRQKLLLQDGTLVIYVPAFQHLYSPADERVGHFRRYNVNSLFKAIKESGLKVNSWQYVDSLGYLSLLLFKYLLRTSPELKKQKRLLRFYDSVIFPVSRSLDKLSYGRVVGKNILIVAKN